MKKYQGVVVPMVSPLNRKLKIDKEAVGKIMEQFSQNGISPLVLGTTGEASSLSGREKLDILKAAISAKGRGQIIYAGIVSNQVREQLDMAKKYLDLGADVVVATLPSYYMLSSDQMKKHFEFLGDGINGPLMIYNIKATTQMSIPLEVISSLSMHPNICGLKDSERDIGRLENAIQLYRDNPDFSYFCGWGSQTAYSLSLGADGIVPSTGNIVPKIYAKLFREAVEGNILKAMKSQTISDQVGAIYQSEKTLGQSLAALKCIMKVEGLCQDYMKPPLDRLEKSKSEEVLNQWNAMHNIH